MHKPVLFRVTNNLKIGGVESRLRALLPLLLEDYEVHVVVYKKKGVFYDELTALGVHTHFLSRKGHWNPLAIWRLARLFRTYKADIVHTHSFGGNIFGILAAALARVPVRIAQVHTMLHWYGRTAIRRKKQILEEKFVHRLFTHKILFVSEESRTYFQKHTKLPDEMLEIMHNGIALSHPAMPLSREDLGLPATAILVGFVGRIEEYKRIDSFLELAKEAATVSPGKFHFVIIGSGSSLAKSQNWVREHGLEKAVTFLGMRKDIHRCYATLDALVFCSEPGVEGMPGVVLEACAHGLPILARRTAPLEEIARYYSRIVYFDSTTPAVRQLDQLMALPVADQTDLINEFSIEAMRQRTCKLYDSLTRQ